MPSASFPPTQRTANPYIIHPSPPPPPQQNHQPMHSGYTPGGDDYEARRLQPPSNPYIVHPSPPPPPQQNNERRQSSCMSGDADHEIHGDKDQSDLPPVYTTMQD